MDLRNCNCTISAGIPRGLSLSALAASPPLKENQIKIFSRIVIAFIFIKIGAAYRCSKRWVVSSEVGSMDLVESEGNR